jgi:SAM-dependent methyltransferase|tara:strand:+ start:20393 stop:21178 length:786 start_codon:yes stop_codon:yes gene_type:complete
MLTRGDRFQYQSVVDRYRLRPEYPDEIHDQLRSFVERDSTVLDIGCGPGKLSYRIAPHVSRVAAVDLSAGMIAAAIADSRDDSNISWLVGDIHTTRLDVGYDLMMAGASIHWMNWDALFRMLEPLQSARGKIVFLEGDGAVNQPWGFDELELLKALQLDINEQRPEWVDRASFPEKVKENLVIHPLFTRQGSISVVHRVHKTIDDYIEVNFSRQSCALDCMPRVRADQFRFDMLELLTPHADNGLLSYDVRVICEWGRLHN